jgi:hypothetical protein
MYCCTYVWVHIGQILRDCGCEMGEKEQEERLIIRGCYGQFLMSYGRTT